ncbi:hypothetical protein HUT05_00490 [Streptomyces chartreusis]|uniref:WhiB family transcriptional regulator n=1 Tax=Streptomyces chartreusis TaxID=1969 RepID=A0A7H8TM47_STRCX|nr:hypothetical protein HUT05_00490 [Streptomyces chartreusis]
MVRGAGPPANRRNSGIWGGMTERERRSLLRRRPLVRSWRGLLECARSEYEQLACPGEDLNWTAVG